MGYQKNGRIIEQTQTTATAAGTTTLVNTSKQNQTFTGTSVQDVALPDATTCPNGTIFRFKNESTQAITIEYDDNTTLSLIQSGGDLLVVLRDNSTSNGVWSQFASAGSVDSKPLYIRATTSGVQSIPNATVTVINWGSTLEDNTNSFSSPSFTVPAGYAGFYLFDVGIESEPASLAESDLYFQINAVDIFHPFYDVTDKTHTANASFGYYLEEGDVVTFAYRHNQGSAHNIGLAQYSHLTINRYVATGSTNQAVTVFAYNNAGTVTAVNTTIPGWVEVRDTASSFDPTTGVFTVPVAGDYWVSCQLQTSSTSNSVMSIRKNGTQIVEQQAAETTGNGFCGASTLVTGCVVGDTLTITLNSVRTLSASTLENTLSIFKINDVSENAPVAVIADSSATTLTSGGNTIVATNITTDTSNSFSGGTFTAPVSGFYQCNMYLQGASVSYTAGDAFSAYIEANAVVVPLGVTRVQVTGTHNLITSGGQTVYVLAGQTIVFKGASTTSTSIGAFQGSIIKVG